MLITGKGNNVLDAQLLARLGGERMDGGTISKAEVQDSIDSIKEDLKDSFTTSTRGLARAEKAIVNTLNLAIKSNWIRGGQANDILDAFMKGKDEGSLSDTIKDVRSEVRSYQRSNRSSYGSYRSACGYSSSRSYSSCGSRSYGT